MILKKNESTESTGKRGKNIFIRLEDVVFTDFDNCYMKSKRNMQPVNIFNKTGLFQRQSFAFL